MTYEFHCMKCDVMFDVVKPVAEIAHPELCKVCGNEATRSFVPSRIHIHGAAVEHAEYNPALGCITKNKKHRAELAKERGMVEIGNDFKSPDAIHKKFDGDREDRKKKAWEDV